MKINLILPYPPTTNSIWRHYRGATVLSRKYQAYKVEVAYLAGLQQAPKLCGPLAVTGHVYRPRKIGDVDGSIKALLDSLNGICYEDDKQITELHWFRHDDKQDPRAELTIEELE